MALETLKDFTHVGGQPILDMTNARKNFENLQPIAQRQDGVDFSRETWDAFYTRVLKPHNFITVDHETNTISFKIQQGPIKEKGLNGCQLTDLVVVANHMVTELSKNHPCAENDLTTMYWEKGLQAQADRTKDRETRNVEGTSAH